MAVLSKIRQRSILLIGIIGFCLFAFIIGDIFNQGGFNSMPKDVGTVNGRDIAFEDFRIKVANLEKSGQGAGMQAVNRVWEQEVTVALLTEEFEKLGIRVSDKHRIEVLKQDPQIGQNPQFLNAAGQFDINKFNEFFKANPEGQQYVKDRMKEAELAAKYMIYNSMVKGGVFTTNLEGKLKYEMENNKVTFDYVAVPYSSVKDSEVKVTDDEIVAYMRKNEKRWKADETREVEYVLIEDKPSADDEKEVSENINALLKGRVVYNQATGKNDTLPGFGTTNNVVQFVNENSDLGYDSTYVAKKDLPAAAADAIFSLPEGQVYGPYRDGDFLKLTRVLGRKSNASAKASHILISWEGTPVPQQKEKRTKEQAKAKADSLFAQAKANPSMFMMLALTNSDDSSAQRGGDLGYFAPGQMVPAFNDYVFNNPVGSIGMVETEFGYHIINVTDKQDAIRMATVARRIQPSDATIDKMYQTAVKFEMDATEGDFEKVAKAAGIPVNPSVKVKVMDEYFGAAGSQRQIVRWAFENGTKVGDVKRFEVANVGNIIARLKKINEEGLMAIDEARPQIEPKLKNQKKAEIIRKKLTGGSLEAMAKSAGVTVQTAADMTLENAVIPGMGREQKIVGTAMSIGANQTSQPIEGMSGVAVVRTKAVAKAPEMKDYKEFVNKVKAQRAGDANRVIPALRVDADIEDNRAKFNY